MASSSPEDDDTKAGFQARWVADSALALAVPGGLHAGRLIAGLASPWARISCEQGTQPNKYFAPAVTGAGYWDHRHVRIEIIGIKPAVIAALAPARAAFEWQPKGPLAMSIPNATLKVVLPLAGNAKVEEDPNRRQGEDLWRGVLELEVWSVRTIP